VITALESEGNGETRIIEASRIVLLTAYNESDQMRRMTQREVRHTVEKRNKRIYRVWWENL
jgi:hypothetical protein